MLLMQHSCACLSEPQFVCCLGLIYGDRHRPCRCVPCIARSTRVSNEVGDGNVDKAKNAVSVTLKLSVLVGVSFVLLLEFSNGLWANLGGSTVVVSEFTAITRHS